MRILRQLLIPGIALITLIAAWLYWWQPQRVDMAAYVPADSLVYVEANSLTDIAGSLTATDAWKALAPPAGIKSSLGEVGWLGRLAAWTGIGSADAVVLSRAQVAVTIMGFDPADAGETLNIRMRAAIIAETHTSESRTRAAVETRIGDFARRAYGQPIIKHDEIEGVSFTTWSAQGSERRIIAAVSDSLAVIGNDESTVRACLAVRHGERPSLAGNQQMEEMRRRVGAREALVFGYVSQLGAEHLFEVAAPVYVGQMASDTRAQSLAASLLPQLAKKILGGAGWSAHLAGGVIEDRYFLSLQNSVTPRLREALAPSTSATLTASELLPGDTYSMSRYSYRDPEAAWRGLNATLSSQLPALGAIIITGVLKASLKPYGIDEPESFMRAIGPEIVTARPDDTGERTLTIVEVRDEKALRDFVMKRLETRAPLVEQIGDSALLRSTDAKRGAASFIAGRLIMGTVEDVRRSLLARAQKKTLSTLDAFQRAARSVEADNPPGTVTYTKNTDSTRAFISAIASQREARERPADSVALEHALDQLAYTVSETRLIEGGFERKTRSPFGQFSTLAAQFVPDVEKKK